MEDIRHPKQLLSYRPIGKNKTWTTIKDTTRRI